MNIFRLKHRSLAECRSCVELRTEWAIRSPGELEKALRVVSGNLADGTLIESPVGPTRNDVIEPTPFANLIGASTRPDFIKCDFECTECGEQFHLRCETYHDSGGGWSYGKIG